MAETMQFDLVSPERKLASVPARSVQIPGMEGDLTALPEHSPLLTTLRPGIVKVTTASETSEYVVTGGFAEISPSAASVLAEQACEKPAFSIDMMDALMREAEADLRDAPDDLKMAAAQRLRDVAALKARLDL